MNNYVDRNEFLDQLKTVYPPDLAEKLDTHKINEFIVQSSYYRSSSSAYSIPSVAKYLEGYLPYVPNSLTAAIDRVRIVFEITSYSFVRFIFLHGSSASGLRPPALYLRKTNRSKPNGNGTSTENND
jgi:hypothetical protein